ncbi:MAG: Fe2+-dependent dioxygenase [Kangiella sp.]|nr:MAG: Fe2+-dependent dioxygenase [Kangiella sp.]
MFLEIPKILNLNELNQLKVLAEKAKFVDGKISNPHNLTKNNLQLDNQSPIYKESSQILHNALLRNENFRNFALPSRITPPLLCKYDVNMSYGIHSDNAFISQPQQTPIRSDISATFFLNDPKSYEGGELVIHIENQKVEIKLDAGAVIIYPSTYLHEVKAVSNGNRLVAIAFIQSQIRDEKQRELIYNVGEVEALEGFNIQHENRVRLNFIRQSLIRMWS